MPTTVDLQHESLAYSAIFARPPLALWGAGGTDSRRNLRSAHPHNVTLRNIQVNSSVPTAADPIVTVQLGTTVLKFSFEKIEVAFSGFKLKRQFVASPSFWKAFYGLVTEGFSVCVTRSFLLHALFLGLGTS